MPEIIERTLAFSNEQMVDYLESMKRAIEAVPEVKKGKRFVKKALSPMSKAALEKINYSIEYYKNTEEYVYERDDDDIDDSSDMFSVDGSVQFRDYQVEAIDAATEILKQHRFVYLRMQVRTGKTLTAFGICDGMNATNVLFVTKKKAMTSVSRDYGKMAPDFKLTLLNYESLHKIDDVDFDFIIIDEAHSLSMMPKPSTRAVQIKDIISKCNPHVILMSGTPTPESYSQMYHQVYGIPNNPFRQYRNFYAFAKDYVNVKIKKINSMDFNDYSDGKESIIDAMKPYSIYLTQQDAGFTSSIQEHVLYVEPCEVTKKMTSLLKKHRIIQGTEEVILADTGAKFMSKLHQMYAGTVKFESGRAVVFSYFKAEFIQRQFDGCKIAIFYKFKEEYNALKDVFKDKITDNYELFRDTPDMNLAWQIVSGREGTSLKEAEYIVYYNIDFSATSYWQSRDRMTTIDRPSNEVYWIFTAGSLDDKIYKMVKKKKNYTLKHFEKDLGL